MCFLSVACAGPGDSPRDFVLPASDASDASDTGADIGADAGADANPVPWQGPDLALQDCDGVERSFASLVGSDGLVLAIGAAWCGPCQKDAPVMEAFSQAQPTIGVVQVLVEDADAAPATRLACSQWVDDHTLTHPVLVDPAYLTTNLVEGGAFPYHLVYDPAGVQVLGEAAAFDGAAVLAALGGG